MIILDPSNPTDPFCSCPKCKLIATHTLEEVREMVRDTQGRPTPTFLHKGWARQCVFCHHRWIVEK